MKSILFYFTISILTISTFISCNDAIDQVTLLEAEVIAIHDQAMAKTSTLYALKKALKTKLNESGDSTQIFDLIKRLDDADEEMMVWMDQYEAPDADRSKESNLSNLNQQKVKIINVQLAIDEAIKVSNEYLK